MRTRPVRAAFVALFALLGACSQPEADDPAAFCATLQRVSAPESAISSLDLNDATSFDAVLVDLDALNTDTPDDITSDVEVVTAVYREVITALAGTAPGARPDALAQLQSRLDEAEPAASALQTYGRDTCGLSFEGPAAPTPTPTPLEIND